MFYTVYSKHSWLTLRGIFRAQTHCHFRKIWIGWRFSPHPSWGNMNHWICLSEKTNLNYDLTVLINWWLSLWLSSVLKIFVEPLHHNNHQQSQNQLQQNQKLITNTINCLWTSRFRSLIILNPFFPNLNLIFAKLIRFKAYNLPTDAPSLRPRFYSLDPF